MAESNVEGGPIFVDVGLGPQYPILYNQLPNNSDEGKQEAALDISQNYAANDVKNEGVAVVIEGMDSDKDGDDDSTDEQKQGSNSTKILEKKESDRVRCPECHRYTTESEEKLLYHIRRVHRGENPFQCYMCDYSTYNTVLFEEHVNIHQGIKPYKCSQCPYRSASKKNTKKHENIHRPDNPLKCHKCDFIGRNNMALLSHLRNKHKDIKTNRDQKYECALCDESFKTHKELVSHRKHVISCDLCIFKCCKKSNLKMHYIKAHNKTAGNLKKEKSITFQCSLCTWSSNIMPRILLHLIHHPNQKVDESVIDISVLRNCGIME